MTEYVYIIQQSVGHQVKIGRSQNVETRLSELQCGNPFQLSIIHKFACGNRLESEILEKHFHKALHNHACKHFGGTEWFHRSALGELMRAGKKLIEGEEYKYLDLEFIGGRAMELFLSVDEGKRGKMLKLYSKRGEKNIRKHNKKRK